MDQNGQPLRNIMKKCTDQLNISIEQAEIIQEQMEDKLNDF